MIELGDRAKNNINGYQGIVVGITSWLTGCRQVGIKSEKLKDELPLVIQWFDENEIEIICSRAHGGKLAEEKPGGPKETPKRNMCPKQ